MVSVVVINQYEHHMPMMLLHDVCSRFIIDLPQLYKDNMMRICSQVELAHWFYLDYYCAMENSSLRPCGIRIFATHVFQYVPYLRENLNRVHEFIDNWRNFKKLIPRFGAILLDSDLTHIALVQSFFSRPTWSFPKGKIYEGEMPWTCATREVFEETGLDISTLINKADYIEATIHTHRVRLYVVANIPRNTEFIPRTQHEIKAIEWFPIDFFPINRYDMTKKVKMGFCYKYFYSVQPFIKQIRMWVQVNRGKLHFHRVK
ncbi:m7GpppN-mRNA hydrolase-like [Colias croceus]|uniref:m7GpppN-mRNA hydrolase-like n=1 Tax=Colias crocea TaxID=72248 RepID=UPI001E27C3EB|nr:m7GpppN-mRNA hydrolase-like [Colias croceus]XP_045510422.1 m7GpppN-mRNA hydrolase-like [Colias croceus]XP_045510423.1 m7GpppN-mRNA hydrolase-like [Colias croceus]